MKEYVSIMLIDQQKRVLLQFRDDKETIWNPNAWSTFGGAIDAGETPLQAVIRETKEESNHSLKSPVFLTVASLDHIGTIHFFYEQIRDEEKSTLQLLEGSDWGWFSSEELKQLDWKLGNPIKKLVYDMLKELLTTL